MKPVASFLPFRTALQRFLFRLKNTSRSAPVFRTQNAMSEESAIKNTPHLFHRYQQEMRTLHSVFCSDSPASGSSSAQISTKFGPVFSLHSHLRVTSIYKEPVQKPPFSHLFRLFYIRLEVLLSLLFFPCCSAPGYKKRSRLHFCALNPFIYNFIIFTADCYSAVSSLLRSGRLSSMSLRAPAFFMLRMSAYFIPLAGQRDAVCRE